jgi:ribosome-associated protein
MQTIEIVREASQAAKDKKALRPILIDVRDVSDLCDFHLICSGENERQTRAIADAIEERCFKVSGLKPVAIEGKQTGNWIVMDYGSFLVHIFYNYLRDYYGIEQLWSRGKFTDLNQ